MKALVLDIDGTITHRDRKIDCRAVEVIRRIRVPVILATGNTVCFATTTSRLIGIGGMVIAENGGVVKAGYDEEEHIIGDISPCIRAFEILKKHFDLEKLDPSYRRTEIAVRRNFDLDKARTILSGTELEKEVDIVDSGFALHIKNRKVNKGVGLKKLAELFYWSVKDVAVIGDSENDVEMFEVAGLGIAVGNADDKLKEIADFVTKKEYGAGFVEAMEFLFPKLIQSHYKHDCTYHQQDDADDTFYER
ncbi:MAG: phosphoglycolate phosphatase [Methanocellales archaeon]|nr:phosphoglycolate phosphatase [Methanocellales archaeon]